MSGKRPRPSPVDDPAWEAVKRSVKPLAKRVLPVPEPLGPKPAAALPRKAAAALKPAQSARPVPQPLAVPVLRPRSTPPTIEDRLLKAIRRGQTPIDMRLDLHGETQERAQRLLERVLAAGRARGARIVLVVTGTGLRRALQAETPEESRGVLRRMLPLWLAAPPLSDWVIGLAPAAPHHGGAGAFYVLLRRQRTV